MRRERADHDVIVVGAGVAGAAMALALAQQRLDVAVVDTRAPEPFDPAAEVDLRVFALSPASIALLDRVGAWSRIARQRVSPYSRMRVFERDASDEVAFDAALVGARDLGVIVEDRLLRAELWAQLDAARVTRRCPARATALEPGRETATLVLDDGSAPSARLVIAADGAASPVRGFAGIEVDAEPYGERAIVAHVAHSRSHEATAWQRFTPDGPLALLPLADGRSSIVWSAKDARATALLRLDDDAFRAALAEAFGDRLGAFDAITARAAYPLRLQLAQRYAGDRVALVGDAAHVVHPLAGQGLNLGLLDVGALAETIADATRAKRDPGDAATLRAYDGWRRGDAALAARAFDTLDGLFRGDRLGLPWLRRVGMGLVNRSSAVKRELALHACGFSGRVPALSRR